MKRITVKQFTLCLSLIVSCLLAKAQTVNCYFPAEYNVDAGSTFTAEVRVDSFINLGSSGFSINWDPEVLRYNEVSELGVTLNVLSGVNDGGAVSDGRLGFVWINGSATEGVTLPDSTLLMSIVFEVVGNAGDTTSLRFTDTPVVREFSDLQPMTIPSTFSNAAVTVLGVSSASYNSAPEKISLHPPVPNPFQENTQIRVDLRQAAQTNIKIIDQTGRVLHENQEYLGAGLHAIPISREIFEQSGTYYCLLTSSDFRVMQKLVFIDR